MLEASCLLGERTRYLREVERLAQVSSAVVVPDANTANNTMSETALLRGLFDRLASARAREERAQRNHDGATLLVKVPSSEVFARVDKAKGILADMATYALRRNTARADIATATRELEAAKKNLALLTEEVGTLLGSRGECPVCRTLCDTGAGGPHPQTH